MGGLHLTLQASKQESVQAICRPINCKVRPNRGAESGFCLGASLA